MFCINVCMINSYYAFHILSEKNGEIMSALLNMLPNGYVGGGAIIMRALAL